ncbi:hypothetical protein LTR94_030759, partial [Friedmanniomyces endolithicus]
VRLYRQWPGGPVIGTFTAGYGPDNRLLRTFTLRVGKAAGLPALLDEGVRRMDAAYQEGLRGGYLRADSGLNPIMPVATPTPGQTVDDLLDTLAPTTPSTTITVQFDTPDAGAVTGGEAAMRGVPGVASASTTSLALGGVSLMTVGYAGTPDAFRAALEARAQTSITDIGNFAPNVNIQPAYSSFGSSINAFIRGVGQNDSNFALEPGV